MPSRLIRILFFMPVSFPFLLAAPSSPVLSPAAPRIYLDCAHDFCDMDYIRSEIRFVDYVVDRREADIHILITRRQTGSGGREYTVALLGRNGFAAKSDTIVYTTEYDDTRDEQRAKMVQFLKLGLVPFMNRTPLAGDMAVSYNRSGGAGVSVDPWNHWVFRTRLRAWFDGEKLRKNSSKEAGLSADRITETWKIRLSANGRNHESRSTVEDTVYTGGDTTYVSLSENRSFNGLFVRSISGHWSAGISIFAYRSSYENIRLSYGFSPAVEYAFFPYSESTRRELRLLYTMGMKNNRYRDMTLYNRMEEGLLSERLEFVFKVMQPWGEVETSLSGSHYFHDLKKYRIHFWSELSLRLFRGFSLNAYGYFSRIHDQLSLVKGGSDLVEILLRRRQLSTQYSYYFSLGFEYAFGSLFNNVVNPRFGY